jgi:glycosyltransferase involved in cell wall biosynthesis
MGQALRARDRAGTSGDPVQRTPLSVVVTTWNEAGNLPGCLESVRWADDVLVVDSGSRDSTVEIARAYGARVLVHPYESAGRQKNWALGHVARPWVLVLDADERPTPELAAEIREVVCRDGPLDGYFLSRRSFFLGREIRHCGWDGDRVLRLFRAGRGLYDDRLVHETLRLDGREGQLHAPLLHYTYRTFSDYLDKLERYTARGAADLRAAGKHASLAALLLRPPARFLRMYFLQLGFLDGVHGLLLCTLSAHSVWLKYARQFEPVVAPGAGTATLEAPVSVPFVTTAEAAVVETSPQKVSP